MLPTAAARTDRTGRATRASSHRRAAAPWRTNASHGGGRQAVGNGTHGGRGVYRGGVAPPPAGGGVRPSHRITASTTASPPAPSVLAAVGHPVTFWPAATFAAVWATVPTRLSGSSSPAAAQTARTNRPARSAGHPARSSPPPTAQARAFRRCRQCRPSRAAAATAPTAAFISPTGTRAASPNRCQTHASASVIPFFGSGG